MRRSGTDLAQVTPERHSSAGVPGNTIGTADQQFRSVPAASVRRARQKGATPERSMNVPVGPSPPRVARSTIASVPS